MVDGVKKNNLDIVLIEILVSYPLTDLISIVRLDFLIVKYNLYNITVVLDFLILFVKLLSVCYSIAHCIVISIGRVNFDCRIGFFYPKI